MNGSASVTAFLLSKSLGWWSATRQFVKHSEYPIPTVDERDFSAFRLKGRKRFEHVQWYRK
jgi:hypothetical protein